MAHSRAKNSHRFKFQTAARSRDTASRSRRAFSREFCPERRAFLRSEGAGNAGRSMHPQPRTQDKKAHERSHHGHTGNHPAFPAQWFYGVLRALPGDEFVLSPSLPDWRLAEPGRARFASGSLAPATGVRTTRLGRTQKAPIILRAALRSRGSSRPAIAFSRLTPSRPPHPAPRP
jgi:hypothetical protein